MVGFNTDFIENVRQLALDWIEDANADVRAAIWEEGPPPGFTVMNDSDEQAIMEEFSILAAQGKRPGIEVTQHPVVRRRIQELEQQQREAEGEVPDASM